MDSTLPQMESFAFDRPDPIAPLEQTLAYLRQYPEPRAEDVAAFSYTRMLDEVVAEKDWMGGMQEDLGGQLM